MIKATIIFGGDAIKYYNETGQLPSTEWLMDNGGVVQDIEFPTKRNTTPTCKAYRMPICGAIITSFRKLPKHPKRKVRFGCDWA